LATPTGAWKVLLSRTNTNAGFTLIEVLIALAILSISLTAIIKSTSQNIKDTGYLQDKTIAHWVGMNALNEARLGITKPTTSPTPQDTEMLGEHWTTETNYSASKNPHIRELHVVVKKQGSSKKLITLTGYLYVA
jgi:general secretion pathway protein I